MEIIEKLLNLNKEKSKIVVIYILGGLFLILSLTAFLLASFSVYVYFRDISKFEVIESTPRFFKKSIDTLRDIPYLVYKFQSSSLPVYKLYISDKDYKEINDALPNAYITLPSESKKKVPARLVYNGQEKNIEVGYRGDSYIHWFFEEKSWAFIFQPNDLLEGQSEIRLIVPWDRVYVGEYLANYRARKLGLPTPDDKFVILRINNGPKMLYYQIEVWSNEFLKKHFGTDDGNLYGENDTTAGSIFASSMFWKKYTSVKGQENNYADLDYLLDLINNASKDEFKEKITAILDMDNFYNWHIQSILSGTPGQDRNHNVRLYFDRQKGKFFLIPWDAGLDVYGSIFDTQNPDESFNLDNDYNPLVNRILDIPEFLSERNKRLWNYVKNDKNLEEDLAYFDKAYQEIRVALYNDSAKFWRSGAAEAQIKNARSAVVANYNFFRQQLDRAEVSATVSLKSKSQVPITIDLFYRSASPINFNNLSISSKAFQGADFLQLYEDTNNNGFLDGYDLKVADLKYQDGSLSLSKPGPILYTNRRYNGYQIPISLDITKKKFFVTSSLPFVIKDLNISFNILNEVTKSKIETTVHVNDFESILSSK